MKTLTTLSILFVVAASAMAGGNQTSPTDIIAKVDADGDGKISKSEFTGPAEVFAKLDANGDGSITAQEIEVAQGEENAEAPAAPAEETTETTEE